MSDLKDSIKLSGRVKLTWKDEQGNTLAVQQINNLVVTAGLEHIADRLAAVGQSAMSHMAIGDSNTAPSASQTTLSHELARVALDSVVRSGVNVTYTATFGPGVGTSSGLQEAGILNDPTTGVMLCRTTYTSMPKSASTTLVIEWTVSVAV